MGLGLLLGLVLVGLGVAVAVGFVFGEAGVPGRGRLEYLGEGGWSTWEKGLEYLGEGVRVPGRRG